MILVCGDIILDETREYKSMRPSQEAPLPILNLYKKKFFLGGASNVANNIKKLSSKVFLLGVVGKDQKGFEIKRLLKKNKIENKLIVDKRYKTSHKKRGYLDNKMIFRIDNDNSKKIFTSHGQLLLKFVKKNIKKFQLLVISDYDKGFFNREFIKKISTIFRKNRKLIITNPKKRDVTFYNHSNILVPNEKEFNNFFEKKLNLSKKLQIVFDKTKDIEHLIVTRGYKNVLYANKNKKLKYLKVNKTQSIDVTGASDTFIATLSVYINNRKNIYFATKKAIIASKKVIKKKYTSFVSLREIEK